MNKLLCVIGFCMMLFSTATLAMQCTISDGSVLDIEPGDNDTTLINDSVFSTVDISNIEYGAITVHETWLRNEDGVIVALTIISRNDSDKVYKKIYLLEDEAVNIGVCQ